MNGKIKVGAVSYLNTKPMVHLFERGHLADLFTFHFDYPSNVAQQLLNDDIDLGLVPVAVIPQLNNSHIVSDYCIATEGEVASVCLFSEVPLDQIKTILLDYQSRSSVGLLKILLKHHWKINPILIEANAGFENQISNTTAGLVIGDRALVKRNTTSHVFDLGVAWKEMTGLPFVFAVWLANKKLDDSKMALFNIEVEKGLSMIPTVVSKMDYKHYDLLHYYQKNISYILDDKKRAAIEKYLAYLKEF